MHFTPTSASWLNAVETLFAGLSKRRLKHGVFHSVLELNQAIRDYLDGHNAGPKPFTWTAPADTIIAKQQRGKHVLDFADPKARRSQQLAADLHVRNAILCKEVGVNKRLGRSRAAILAACACFGSAWISNTAANAAHHRSYVAHRMLYKTVHEAHRIQIGQASVYSSKFAGRKMATGGRFSLASDSAASSTLPLGTVAAVTNLRNGRTTMIEIRDRSSHHARRIVDLSPQSARKLGISEHGIGRVALALLSTPSRRHTNQ